MLIKGVVLFLAGLFFANGIPHFVNGISGRNFHNPSLHRFMPNVPSPLFNVIWGLLNFGLALLLLTAAEIKTPFVRLEGILFALGFAFASIGLSLFFNRPVKNQ
ncbi:MAG: hypothetical protein GC204_08075 [Chloroflexi bacterium]|nr:hypothetical protein [Chloroflexota bacterium]